MINRLYILGGANGSGKSTIARELLPAENLEFVNPDEIARELCPTNLESVKIAAGKEAIRRANDYLERGVSFAIESTLSGNVYVKVIEKAKSLGYEVNIAYTFVDSPEVCVARIAERVRHGGHNVPPEDVRRRFWRSRKNFLNVYAALADNWWLVSNAGGELILVAVKHKDEEVEVLSEQDYKEFEEAVCHSEQ